MIKLITISIHSGELTSFWFDPWASPKPLRYTAPAIFKICENKAGNLTDFITQDQEWSIPLSRDLRPPEISQIAEVLYVINSPPLLSQDQDEIHWSLNLKGFSVKSLYDYQSNTPSDQEFPTNLIWNHMIPPKLCFFFWTAVLDKILTLNNLKKRGHQLANCCFLCSRAEETPAHLLLNCHYSRRIWDSILPNFGWCWSFPSSVLQFAQGWSAKGFSKLGKLIWKLIPAVVFWAIWCERNRRAFEGKAKNTLHLQTREGKGREGKGRERKN
ncbi:Reverse transcriptase zinc-binding domain [Macleaya cordata]|uniref:Reverse transcriptase zinc-binding domain n=1 Tax=Macleaya cordata TaxID=56857 RepID=A0A200QUT0_MACCD|nr:Reverse transcriptase zinc-binding domain [Macleaya cordata]